MYEGVSTASSLPARSGCPRVPVHLERDFTEMDDQQITR